MATGLVVVAIGDLLNLAPSPRFDTLGQLVSAVPGWEVVSLPLGGTPEQSKVVEKTLQCDRAINLQYTRDEFRISVYAGYWRPGKMPVHLVARHTPDVCWVAAGWRRLDGGSKDRLPVAEGRTMPRIEYRTFQHAAATEYVVFFHVIDGEISSLDESDQGLGSVFGWVTNIFRYEFFFWHIGREGSERTPTVGMEQSSDRKSRLSSLFRQRPEQMFVRISSNLPLDEFWATPVVSGFIRQLPIRIGSAPAPFILTP